jgi:hypothetical protein
VSRNRASAKAAGSRFERTIADYLAEHVDDRIDRRVKTGALDKGDIAGLRVHGQRVVIECKDYAGRVELAAWLREAEAERVNDGALAGMVAFKRRLIGYPGQQGVLMPVDDLIALITGNRDHVQ